MPALTKDQIAKAIAENVGLQRNRSIELAEVLIGLVKDRPRDFQRFKEALSERTLAYAQGAQQGLDYFPTLLFCPVLFRFSRFNSKASKWLNDPLRRLL